MTALNVTARVFHDSNVAFILIFAVSQLWLIQHEIYCGYFFIFNGR